jgi:hypothetical protein
MDLFRHRRTGSSQKPPRQFLDGSLKAGKSTPSIFLAASMKVSVLFDHGLRHAMAALCSLISGHVFWNPFNETIDLMAGILFL